MSFSAGYSVLKPAPPNICKIELKANKMKQNVRNSNVLNSANLTKDMSKKSNVISTGSVRSLLMSSLI